MVKKQQMRWSSPGGAHLLLQVRTHVLNDDLSADFARWYPGFAALDQQRLAGRRTGPWGVRGGLRQPRVVLSPPARRDTVLGSVPREVLDEVDDEVPVVELLLDAEVRPPVRNAFGRSAAPRRAADHLGIADRGAVAAQPERQPVIRAARGQAAVYPCRFTLPMLTAVSMSIRPR
jgi:hypothetical protein